MRIAYSIGLHRQETLANFSEFEQNSRRKIWQSLFIIDRFTAASLGRPVAIAEEECSDAVFNPHSNNHQFSTQIQPDQLCTAGMEAAVRGSHVVGMILKKVYLQRNITIRTAQELADECRKWPESLSPFLHWRQASPGNTRQGIAILHSNLVYCYSLILLSRPFFLYILSVEVRKTWFGCHRPLHRSWKRMKDFSDVCKTTSLHAVAIVQQAYENQYLPRRNPFVTNALFAAALVLLADAFVRGLTDELVKQAIANSITIMSYCSVADPQAKRAVHVLNEFRNASFRRGQHTALQLQQQEVPHSPILAPDTGVPNPKRSPMVGGFVPIPPLPGATMSSMSSPAAATSHPFDPSTLPVPNMPTEDSFSGLLDLTNTVLPSWSEPNSSFDDESVDFDALFGAWPNDFSSFDPATEQYVSPNTATDSVSSPNPGSNHFSSLYTTTPGAPNSYANGTSETNGAGMPPF